MKGNHGKKILTISLSAMLILVAVFSLTGCSKKLYTYGDIVYYRSLGFFEYKITVVGLSEEGKTKEEGEVPDAVYKKHRFDLKTAKIGKSKHWESDKLKKLYLPFGSSDKIDTKLFDSCPNLEKVILYKNHDTNIKISTKNNPDLKVFVSGKNYDEEIYHGSNLYKRSGEGYADIYFANVAFMYNYDRAKNNGYFFIDDCEYGGLVRKPNLEPWRNGFINFLGWGTFNNRYWDFDSDKMPDAKVIDGFEQYQILEFYAEWEGLW